jgi:hypothetical protein
VIKSQTSDAPAAQTTEAQIAAAIRCRDMDEALRMAKRYPDRVIIVPAVKAG